MQWMCSTSEWEDIEINLVIKKNPKKLCLSLLEITISFHKMHNSLPVPFHCSKYKFGLILISAIVCICMLVAQYVLYVHVLQIWLTAALHPILFWLSFITNRKWSNKQYFFLALNCVTSEFLQLSAIVFLRVTSIRTILKSHTIYILFIK